MKTRKILEMRDLVKVLAAEKASSEFEAAKNEGKTKAAACFIDGHSMRGALNSIASRLEDAGLVCTVIGGQMDREDGTASPVLYLVVDFSAIPDFKFKG